MHSSVLPGSQLIQVRIKEKMKEIEYIKENLVYYTCAYTLCRRGETVIRIFSVTYDVKQLEIISLLKLRERDRPFEVSNRSHYVSVLEMKE